METRALAIALFYAIGTAIGGITGPLLFSKLVASGDASQVAWGYLLGAALMVAAGVVQAAIGLEVAQQRLEDIATPITAEEGEEAAEGEEPARKPPAVPPLVRTRSTWSQAPVASPRPPIATHLDREVGRSSVRWRITERSGARTSGDWWARAIGDPDASPPRWRTAECRNFA